MYKLSTINLQTGEYPSVTRLIDNVCIPCDPMNSDYQEYLKWFTEGNTPEPADA